MKRSLLLMAVCLVSAWSLITSVGMTSGDINDDPKKKTVSKNHSTSITVKDCYIMLIKKVVLASGRPGVIDFVTPREGEIVSNDALIVGLRSEVAKAALASATLKAENDIDFRFATEQFKLSDAEYLLNKNVKKFRPAAIADLEVETARLKMTRSKLQIEQALIQRKIDGLARREAEANLKSFQIRAPFQGVVTKLHKRFRGEAVSQGEPILEMANTDYVHIRAEIPLKDALRVKQGDLAEVRLNIPGMDLDIEKITKKGRVVFVDVTVITIGSVVLIKVKVDNPNNMFREGLYAEVTIYPDRKGPIFEDEIPKPAGPSVTQKQ
ncbi:MAG: efflux RND transporter periplasmic adaptor subunit [Planctomycetes bacterium]|nr:efflux RND transporter periplasmic adaptor subunit [Planctomycetota bacterium]